MKPSCCLVVDEDEGFSDWTQRPENRVDIKEGREEDDEVEGRLLEASPAQKVPAEVASQKFLFLLFPAVTSCFCASFQISTTREDIRPLHGSTVFLPQEATTRDHGASLADKTSHQEMASGCVHHSIAQWWLFIFCTESHL